MSKICVLFSQTQLFIQHLKCLQSSSWKLPWKLMKGLGYFLLWWWCLVISKILCTLLKSRFACTLKKKKKNPISRGMEPMWILISLFIILKYRKEWENYLKDFYITWTLETSESMHFKETKSMVTQQKIFTPLCLFASTERFLVSKQGNVKKIGCYYCNSSIFFWASALCLLFLLLSLLLGNSKK